MVIDVDPDYYDNQTNLRAATDNQIILHINSAWSYAESSYSDSTVNIERILPGNKLLKCQRKSYPALSPTTVCLMMHWLIRLIADT